MKIYKMDNMNIRELSSGQLVCWVSKHLEQKDYSFEVAFGGKITNTYMNSNFTLI